VSRRSRRRQGDPAREAGSAPEQERPDVERPKAERPEAERPEKTRGAASRLGPQLLLLAAVFAVAVLVAELFGAANLGVAFGVGQITFAIAVVYLMLRR
jgi:Flp pilus assembly protein TadB